MTTANPQGETPVPVATSVSAKALAESIVDLGITHIITVPDTVQKTFLAYMEQQDKVKILTVCTEDEAMGINAGLYATGHRPMMVIQNNGFYASVNTLKALAFDAQVPTFMFVGQFGRDLTRDSNDNRRRGVRMLEPTMETWGVPFYRLENPEDIGVVEEAYQKCQEVEGPVAVIIGAPTGQ